MRGHVSQHGVQGPLCAKCGTVHGGLAGLHRCDSRVRQISAKGGERAGLCASLGTAFTGAGSPHRGAGAAGQLLSAGPALGALCLRAIYKVGG